MVVPAWAMPQGPKLLIAVLHTGTVSLDWARRYAVLERPGGSPLYSFVSHWPYDVARNACAQSALDHKVEWLFFLDSDVIPPEDAITRLMAHSQPIISGLYYSKVPPHNPQVLQRVPQLQPDGTTKQVFTSRQEWRPGAVIGVDTVATGCLLIHRRVLERFKAEGIPVFEWTLGRKTMLRDELAIGPKDLDALDVLSRMLPSTNPAHSPLVRILQKVRHEPEAEGLSEDFMFGVRAKQLGFPLYVDTSVVCSHVSQQRITGVARVEGMETP